MKRKGLHLFAALLFLLSAATAHAQEWTVIELPAKVADMPQLVQDRFGCSYQELPDKYELTHVRFTGTDFYREDYNSEGEDAIKALLSKAKVIDLSQVKDNEESRQWYADSWYYKDEYPGPARLYYFFTNCRRDSLEHFIFPKTMTRITTGLGSSKKLRQVTWPDRVEIIWDAMFYNCDALKQITIPEGITDLPSSCFRDCDALTSVTLPSTLKTVGDQAFRSCNSLESFTFPYGVETIGNDCFLYCKGLKQVMLPQSITSIGYGTFNGCEKLESVTLPEKVKDIGGSMFYGCKALTSVKLPDSTVTIADNAFSYCSALKRVTVPAGVTTIGSSVFRQTAIEEFDMPDAVTSLGEYVFESCKQLRRVHLSRGLTTIPVRTFSDCVELAEVNIPMRVIRIEHDAFVRCYKMPSPQLPEGLTHIDEYAFWDTRFEHITLPSTLQIIGRESFRYSRLRSIDVPANVVEIKAGAFENCDSLRHATLPDGLLYLQNEAFRDCPLLEDVALPAGLRVLGEWVFHGNKSKKAFVQPPLINVVPNYICCNCDNLQSVTLHERVTAINGSAFRECHKLTHIDLPQGLTLIGDWAFNDTPLEEVNIPASVRRIEERAFNGGQYSRAVVPEGVEYVGARAFYSKNLRYVDFPSTVAQLGDWPFHGDGPACDSIVLRAPVPPHYRGGLYRNWHDGALYVSAASLDAYKQDKGFRESFVNIRPLTGYSPKNVVVATTLSTDSTWFPVADNANLTIAYNPDWNNSFYSGHLHVGENVNWPLDHLRYDYRLGWYGWDEQTTGTLINEGTMSAKSMEMNLQFFANQWFFFTPPFDMKASDLKCSDPRTPFVLRTFSGTQRAAGNHYKVWQDVPDDATLEAGRGYILQYGYYRSVSGIDTWSTSSSDVTFHMQASSPLRTLSLSSDDVTVPLTEYKSEYPHNESWNLIGNPYMAYFDIRQIDYDGPLLIATKEPYTAFEVFSPLDDDFILHPLRAFLVQRSSATQTGITFHSEGRQADRVVRHEAASNARAMRRAALRQQRVVFDAVLQRHTEQGDSVMSRTRVVVTPRATEHYDRGQDAPFITMDDNATAIYSRTNGLRYSLNELPPATQNVELGMHLQEAGTYTLALNMRGDLSHAPEEVWLIDKEKETRTLLTHEASSEGVEVAGTYTFTVTEPGTLNNRFVLQLGDGITAVPSVPSVATQSQQTDQLYDLQGRRVITPTKGLYIKNGKIILHY